MTSISSSFRYKLILIQEPTTGAAFEDNLLGRIGLAPPLILELQVFKDGKLEDASSELPFLFCQCYLLDEQGNVADMVDQSITPIRPPNATLMPPDSPSRTRRGRTSSSSRRGTATASAFLSRSSESVEASASDILDNSPTMVRNDNSTTTPQAGQDSPQLARMLYGTTTTGPQQYLLLEDEEKPYFFFPEISVRTPGKFKIACRLMRLLLPGMPTTSENGILASTETQIFEVVKRNVYAAPYITDVSRHFARQGVPLLLPPGVSAD
ncbi:uncharacterized protein MEPE_04962 [Melanopsichium pennsylvanicum]|uniref:Velvet domain-containing protein n=2 Tax=Melanopsichium pennsylvanicum TaxID=63383 RepID=A0AAJ4XQ40_9BASI|nr:uncharacterized protein MEPE_04962 [Melanopsichium pennsylvanicum]